MVTAQNIVEVIQVIKRPNVMTIKIRFKGDYQGRVAPISLCEKEPPQRVLAILHKLLEEEDENIDENCFVYESYQLVKDLPQAGTEYFISNWQSPIADLIKKDKAIEWQPQRYTNNQTKEYCIITGEMIGVGTENEEGYCSPYGWVTKQTYEKYLRKVTGENAAVSLNSEDVQEPKK